MSEVPLDPERRRYALLGLSVVLTVLGVILVLVALAAFADWRWSALVAGAVLLWFGFVASTRADR
jgi:hypothetical protein